MKKIIILLGLIFISFTLVSCRDIVYDELSVVFYTGPGASVVATAYELEKGDKVIEPEEPTSDAGDFLGWYKEITYTNEWDFENDTLSKSITLFAKWEYYTFTISYELRGGHWPDDTMPSVFPTSYTYMTSINFPTRLADYPIYPKNEPGNPYRGLFLGWWEEPDMTSAERINTPKTGIIPVGTTGHKIFYAYYSQEKD